MYSITSCVSFSKTGKFFEYNLIFSSLFLYDLASEFHSYWNLGKQNPEKRFINDQKTVSSDKLIFLKAISNVVKSGMDIVGVDTPDKM